jgi:nucleoside-diphosphate-sugar epimerase
MRILLAGATGAIGRPLVRCLKEERHTVFALARSSQSTRVMAELGAEPVTADALDAASVKAAMVRVRPDVVINELTALPKHYTAAEMKAAAERDRKVRIEGNANLLAALGEAHARRYMLQSSGFWYEPGMGLADEGTHFAFDASPGVAAGARTYAELEAEASRTPGVELVFLRYGFFYGPGTWYLRKGEMGSRCGSSRSLLSAVARVFGALCTLTMQRRRRQLLWNAFLAHTTWSMATPHLSACGCQRSPSRPGRRRRLRSWSKGPSRRLVRISFTMRHGSEAHRTRRRNVS